MEREAAPATESGLGKSRRIELARRMCIIRADRIDIRPSRGALLPPLFGFMFGALCFALILVDLLVRPNVFPFSMLAVLLVVALICLPLSGMGLIYAAVGANVVIDRAKQSATWQQGLLGLGVGTTELVPFWKIDAILVDEAGALQGRSTEEFAQWEIVLLKKSGRRLTIGRVSGSRSMAAELKRRAVEVAEAVTSLTRAPLRLPDPAGHGGSPSGNETPLPTDRAAPAPRASRRSPTRRRIS